MKSSSLLHVPVPDLYQWTGFSYGLLSVLVDGLDWLGPQTHDLHALG